MAKTTTQPEQAKNKIEGAAERVVANPWVERLARFGYAVRGLLYVIVGVMAVQVALGRGGETTDKGGAIETIGSQPFGKLLLVLVVLGLAGYSLWGFIRAIMDPYNRGNDAKGLAQRAGYVVSGLSYAALIFPTVQFIIGGGNNNQGGASRDLTAGLLSLPLGPWLVGLVGLIGMGGGLGQIWQGVTADFKKDFKSQEMSATEMKWAVRIGKFGLVARGIVFLMLGFFVLQAALHVDPKQAKGLDGVLQTLAREPYGPWLLGVVALGLVSFGVYSALCAKWIHVIRS